jgi:tetratricopeptide (TPR) repeat protein
MSTTPNGAEAPNDTNDTEANSRSRQSGDLSDGDRDSNPDKERKGGSGSESGTSSGSESHSSSDSADSTDSTDSTLSNTSWSGQEFRTAEEEISFFESVIKSLREETSGQNQPRILEALLRLGIAHHKNDDHVQAEEALCKVRQEMGECWGWDHLNSQACVKISAAVLEALGRCDDASALYETAIEGTRRALGREYPWSLELLNNFACLCIRNGNVERAAELFREAYEAKRRVFGKRHKSTLDTLCNLHRVVQDDPGGIGGKGQFPQGALMSKAKMYAP